METTNAPSVAAFIALVNAGVESWVQAGQMLVSLKEQNSSVFAEIIRKNPHLSIDTLMAFERVGRKELYPWLLMDRSPGAAELLRLPYGSQAKYHKTPIEVVTGMRGSKPITQHKHVSELSKKEAKMVFADDDIRTVEQQVILFDPPSSLPSSSEPRRREPEPQPAPPPAPRFTVVKHLKLSLGPNGTFKVTPLDRAPVTMRPVQVFLQRTAESAGTDMRECYIAVCKTLIG